MNRRRQSETMKNLRYAYKKIMNTNSSTDVTQVVYDIPRKVVCFGNVLLERVVMLDNPKVHESYQLKLGSKGELDLEIAIKIAPEAADGSSCLSNSGGSALNTVRILKLLGTEAQFFGAVGDDRTGEYLRSIIADRQIDARLQVIEDMHTGHSLCLMRNDNPTLYTNIGASAKFSVQQLKHAALHGNESFLRPIGRKQIFYIEGFFVPHRAEVIEYILRDLVRERRHLAVNLSAPYIVREHSEEMLNLVKRALFVFGNRQEFEELATAAGCKSVDELGEQLLQADNAKIILVTNGAKGVQLITNYVAEKSPAGQCVFEEYQGQHVAKVVDATGTGDAFVAGFLHAWLEKRSLSECVRKATDVAAKVVTQVGCNLP